MAREAGNDGETPTTGARSAEISRLGQPKRIGGYFRSRRGGTFLGGRPNRRKHSPQFDGRLADPEDERPTDE
jgi:hypothetical protein